MMNGFEYMYMQMCKSIFYELKKCISGGIYVNYDNENDILFVDVTNHDLRWEHGYKNFSQIINKENARSLTTKIVKDYTIAIENEFFVTGKKNGRSLYGGNNAKKVTTKVADKQSDIQEAEGEEEVR